jgi:hypothetical protein
VVVRAALLIALLAACGSKAPPPDAQIDAHLIQAPDAQPPVACAAGPSSGQTCASLYEVCPIAGGCCVCGGTAGLCADIWVCATPSANAAACPATQPAQDSECAAAQGTQCDYYGSAGEPVRAECIDATTYLPCHQAGLTRCWHSSDQGAGCD